MMPVAKCSALNNAEKSAHKRGAKRRPFPFAFSVTWCGVERNVNPGIEVRPDRDAPLFVVSDTKKLTLLMAVFEVNLRKIRLGQKSIDFGTCLSGRTISRPRCSTSVRCWTRRPVPYRCVAICPMRTAVYYRVCTPPSQWKAIRR